MASIVEALFIYREKLNKIQLSFARKQIKYSRKQINKKNS